ncbi:MAG: transposase [Kiritimatiellae bacterium]|nr:transposase [Kiritimatiellia bacterium]
MFGELCGGYGFDKAYLDLPHLALTNNLAWSPYTVAELYGARWDIEVFFKEIKQTVQLVDFLLPG